jgi:hypothetical protein
VEEERIVSGKGDIQSSTKELGEWVVFDLPKEKVVGEGTD